MLAEETANGCIVLTQETYRTCCFLADTPFSNDSRAWRILRPQTFYAIGGLGKTYKVRIQNENQQIIGNFRLRKKLFTTLNYELKKSVKRNPY